MKDINSLAVSIDTKIMNFILLTIVTGGIYPMMWLYLNQTKLTEKMNNNFVAKNYPIWLAIVIGLGWFLTDLSHAVSNSETVLDNIANLLSAASVVMIIVWSFKAKSALQAYALNEFKFELKMNPFYTIVFGICYIVYCINNMDAELQKHNIIHNKK